MKKIFLGMLVVLWLAGNAWGTPINIEYSGWLSDGEGLTGSEPWAPGTGDDRDGAKLSWDVSYFDDDGSDEVSGLWTYNYTLDVTDSDDLRGISHLIVEVSDSFHSESGVDEYGVPYSSNIKDGTTSDWDLDTFDGPSNPSMPGPIYGLKWQDGIPGGESTEYQWFWTIVSDRKPMWGDFYTKDGVYPKGNDGHDVFAYNTGFGLEAETLDSIDGVWKATEIGNGNAMSADGLHAWALVPDTGDGGEFGDPVPEPSTIFLLGGGLLMLAAGYRRKRKK